MATSLYDLSVPTFLQTVTAVAGFLDRAAAHCAQTGADPDDFVEARLCIAASIQKTKSASTATSTMPSSHAAARSSHRAR